MKAGRYRAEVWPLSATPDEVHGLWLKLLADSDGPCPVLQSPAAMKVTAALDPACAVEVFTLRDDAGALVGLMPLQRRPIGLLFGWQGTVLWTWKFPGVAVVGTEPLVTDPELKSAFMGALLRELEGAAAVEFHELKRGDVLEETVEHWARGRYQVLRLTNKEFWSFAQVPGSAKEYSDGLGKKKRYNLARQERLLAEHLGGALELTVVRDPSQIDLVHKALGALTGWTDARLQWAQDDARESCTEGLGCFFILHCQGAPVGLIRAAVWDGVVHVHSMHHDEAHVKFSPGTALWQSALRWIIDQGRFQRIVFAYGMPAHAYRGTLVEERSKVVLLRKGPQAALAAAAYKSFVFARTTTKAAASRLNRLLSRRKAVAEPAAAEA